MINKQTSVLNGVGTQKTHINSEHVFEETEDESKIMYPGYYVPCLSTFLSRVAYMIMIIIIISVKILRLILRLKEKLQF